MRALLILLASLGVVAAGHAADAVTGRIVKVLPFFLNQQGQDSLSPSLFDRDAYQAFLRDHTNQISAVRYDVLWQATKAADEKLKVVLELRGISPTNTPALKIMETNVVPATHRQWLALPLAGADYKNFGTVVAWRVRLWNDGQMLGEQKSFLW
jgi:hypothetical protein